MGTFSYSVFWQSDPRNMPNRDCIIVLSDDLYLVEQTFLSSVSVSESSACFDILIS